MLKELAHFGFMVFATSAVIIGCLMYNEWSRKHSANIQATVERVSAAPLPDLHALEVNGPRQFIR